MRYYRRNGRCVDFDGSEVGLSLEFAEGLFDNTVQVFSQGTIKIHAAAQC